MASSGGIQRAVSKYCKKRREKTESCVAVLRSTRKQYFFIFSETSASPLPSLASLDHLCGRKIKKGASMECRDTSYGLNRRRPQSPQSLTPTTQISQTTLPSPGPFSPLSSREKWPVSARCSLVSILLQGEKGSKIILYSRTLGKLVCIWPSRLIHCRLTSLPCPRSWNALWCKTILN